MHMGDFNAEVLGDENKRINEEFWLKDWMIPPTSIQHIGVKQTTVCAVEMPILTSRPVGMIQRRDFSM
jgi:hypothetical protein